MAKSKYRWLITASFLIAALVCYWVGFSYGTAGFLAAGALLELFWWISLFKAEKKPVNGNS